MKYTYTLLVILCLSINAAFSQITLTKANQLLLGETYTYNTLDETGFDFGDSGANVTWDFSNLEVDFVNSSTFVDPATLPNGNLFPQATAGSENAGSEIYYYQSEAGMGFYGAILTSGTTIVYSDPQDWIRFPMTFMDTYTDNFSGKVATTAVFDRSGTAEVEVDAYGTLITPAGTFQEVVRVYTYMDYSDKLGGADVANYIEKRYLWYDARSGFPLFTYSDLEYLGTSTKSASYLDANPLNIRSPFAEELQLNVYPNPASDWFTLDYSLTDQSVVEIAMTNLLGQEVFLVSQQEENAGTHQSQVDVSGLAQGTYFVKITVDQKVATYKVLVGR